MVVLNLGTAENLFDGALAPGDGEAFAAPTLATQITWQTVFDDEPDAVVIDLMGSNDNVNWSPIDESTETLGESRVVFSSCLFLKVSIISHTGGSNVTVSLVSKQSAFGPNPTFAAGLTVGGVLETSTIAVDHDGEDLNAAINIFDLGGRYSLLDIIANDSAPWAIRIVNKETGNPDTDYIGIYIDSASSFYIQQTIDNGTPVYLSFYDDDNPTKRYFILSTNFDRSLIEIFDAGPWGATGEGKPAIEFSNHSGDKTAIIFLSDDNELTFHHNSSDWLPDVTIKAGAFVSEVGGIAFPDADPHIVGRWWDNGTNLVRSAG